MPSIHPAVLKEFLSTKEELDAYRERLVHYLTEIQWILYKNCKS